MKTFMEVKFIQAKPMNEEEAFHRGYLQDHKEGSNREGYFIEFDDGYKSWCSKEVFEERYYVPEEMPFSIALEALRTGKKISRRGWNGEGMYLWLKPGTTIKSDWCKDTVLKEIVDANGGEIEALPTICMKTADNKVLTGWVASQEDLFAIDWFVVLK